MAVHAENGEVLGVAEVEPTQAEAVADPVMSVDEKVPEQAPVADPVQEKVQDDPYDIQEPKRAETIPAGKEEAAEKPGETDAAEKDGKTEQQPQQWYTEELAKQAQGLGIPDDIARSFGTKEALGQAMALQARAVADFGQLVIGLEQKNAQAPEPAKEVEQPKAPAPDVQKILAALEDYPDEIKGSVQKAFETAAKVEKLEGLLGEIVSEREQMKKQEAERRSIENARDLERVITSKPEWEKFFGKGGVQANRQNKAILDNWNAVAQTVDALIAGYEARGVQVPDRQDLYVQAVHAQFGNRLSEIATETVRKEVENRKSQGTLRPSAHPSRVGKSRDEMALEVIAAKLQEHAGALGGVSGTRDSFL